MYRSINKILISLVLFCAGINPCMAQLVGPDDKPDAPTAAVAKIGVTEYTSVEKAFEEANKGQTDPVTINLLLGVTLKEATPLTVSKNITLKLNGKQLTCPLGITATVAGDKTFTLQGGVLSGSLVWEGTGKLFAGADVDLSALTVTKDAVKLYRVLLKLPAGHGVVNDIFYGSTKVTAFTQSGEIVCCWLPLHTAAQDIGVSDDQNHRYIVSGVVATTHAVTPLELKENVEQDVYIAEAKASGGTQNQYKTLEKAFEALKTAGGDVKLRSNASFAESLPVLQAVSFDLSGKILSASYGAAFAATGSGNLHIKSGALSGTFAVTGDVVADQSVAMAGANVIDGTGNAVYRVRLTLPSSVQGKALSFTYGAKTDVAIPRIFSNGTTAYIWLPAESTARSFTLKAAGSPDEVVVKNSVTINANHDNHIDLRIGDNVAKLIVGSGSPTETLHTSFHDALVAAAALTGTINCKIELLANVTLNGTSGHAHSTKEDQLVTIDLNGHNLTGDNCWLQATESNSAYILTDSRKTGSLTGQLQINGNIYISEEIAASKIGQIVEQGSAGTQLYRLMATLSSTQGALADGFVTYQLDAPSGTSSSCYMKGNKVCLFLPSGANQHTLEVTADNKLYSASNIMISASHSNVATLRLPTEVAKIGTTNYKTLADALTAAGQQQSPVTIELLNQATLSGKHTISKNLTIDLKEFTLKMEAGSEWAVASGGSLYIKSSTKTATIQGDFTVSDRVCISADVAISGSVIKGTEQVYRTRFYLPDGTTAATYTFNNQKGSLIFPGEKRTNQVVEVVGYAFLQVESGHNDLKVEITNTSVSQKEYQLKQVFLQAFHNNQFNMKAGDNVVSVNGTNYTLFSAALAVANQSGGTIVLLSDLSLSGAHSITNNVAIDLKGHTLNTTDDAYFNIEDSKTLVIKGDNTSSSGSLYGILRMQGGALFVAPEVKIAGMVVREGEELYRCLATGIDNFMGTTTYGSSHTVAIQNGTACFWLPPVTVEHDLTFKANSKSYEVTLQPALPNHNNSVRAYPVVRVDTDATWSNDDNNGYNVYIKEGVRLEITEGVGITNLHRVVMEKGAEIVCKNAILATAGIIYRHEFTRAKTWEAFSLPYHARLVRMTSSTQQKEVRPYQIDGTGGDFWLKTIAPEGRFDYVTEERVMANTGYIIAVPDELTSLTDNTLRIDFVSPTDQFLNRKAAALPEPKAGEFVQTASGMLCKMKLERPFYRLSADGTEYERVDATTDSPADILPFSSFLLSDSKTLATYSTLRMGNLPTAVDRPLLPDLTVRVRAVAGGVSIESERETVLRVYTLMGRPVCLKRIAAGTTFLPLQPGLYIVNHEKVVVR